MSRLLIAASGTGGHIFPAIAVTEALPKSWEITWLGVADRLETQLVPARYELIKVKAGGLQGRGIKQFLTFLQLIATIPKVCSLLKSRQIKVIFTTGGYIAAPAILGGLLCGIPVVLHESNAIPGKVSRLMGRFCSVLALGLEPAAKYLRGCRTMVTGTPVRNSFLSEQSFPNWIPQGFGPLIVVIGGSQGALGLNNMVHPLIPKLLRKGCRIVHLIGPNDPSLLEFNDNNYLAIEFTHDVPALLQHADLVISRAGASAMSELAICGAPTIFVPYPQATDHHQEANALSAAQLGGAVIVHQHSPDKKTLEETIWRLLDSRVPRKDFAYDPLNSMKEGMYRFAVKDAHIKIAEILQRFN